jgi:hypothetical protein
MVVRNASSSSARCRECVEFPAFSGQHAEHFSPDSDRHIHLGATQA